MILYERCNLPNLVSSSIFKMPVNILEAVKSPVVEKPVQHWTQCVVREPFHHVLSTSQYLVKLVCLGTHFGKRCPWGLLPVSCQLLLWLFPTLPHFHYWHLAPDFPIITLAALMTLALELWTKILTCPWILDMTLLHPALRLHNPTMRRPQKLHWGRPGTLGFHLWSLKLK